MTQHVNHVSLVRSVIAHMTTCRVSIHCLHLLQPRVAKIFDYRNRVRDPEDNSFELKLPHVEDHAKPLHQQPYKPPDLSFIVRQRWWHMFWATHMQISQYSGVPRLCCRACHGLLPAINNVSQQTLCSQRIPSEVILSLELPADPQTMVLLRTWCSQASVTRLAKTKSRIPTPITAIKCYLIPQNGHQTYPKLRL